MKWDPNATGMSQMLQPTSNGPSNAERLKVKIIENILYLVSTRREYSCPRNLNLNSQGLASPSDSDSWVWILMSFPTSLLTSTVTWGILGIMVSLTHRSHFWLDFTSSTGIGFRLSVNCDLPLVASTIGCPTHSRWPIHAPCMALHYVGHCQ
jgi:hypothetical protein